MAPYGERARKGVHCQYLRSGQAGAAYRGLFSFNGSEGTEE